MHNPLLFLFLFVFTVSAESILDKIGWKGATGSVIVILLIIFVITSLLFIVYYFTQHENQKRAKRHHAEYLFREACERFGFTKTEVEKIRHLLQHENLVEPQVIFQSVSMYERCVHKEVGMLLGKRISQERMTLENEILTAIRKKSGFHHLAQEHPLVSTRNIAIGQKGSLFGKELRRPLIQSASVVEKDEFSFMLQYDVDKEDVCYVSPGDEIKFAFSRQHDSVYGVALRVLTADGSGTIEVFHTLNFRRNQLRQHVRIEINLPLKFRLLTTDRAEKSEVGRGEVVGAKISDISGGGMSFLCERTLRVGDIISLNFNLPDVKLVGITGRVLRISLQEGRAKSYFRHHVQFKDIESRRRDDIVKYVFEKQRQQSQWR